MITYVSELWGGRVSNEVITKKCGILDLIEKGDNIMAGRGFVIKELLSQKGATFDTPLFLGQCKQLTARGGGNMTYCRVMNSCGESYWEGQKLPNLIQHYSNFCSWGGI